MLNFNGCSKFATRQASHHQTQVQLLNNQKEWEMEHTRERGRQQSPEFGAPQVTQKSVGPFKHDEETTTESF